VLEEARLPGHLIELEITETMLMTDIATTLATLKALNELDVRLSIDDFGTGYSSLSYLKRFDIDQLKIDRSFVNDLKPDSDNETITAAIIAMASALNLEVVAEGVETREQMLLLQKRGCQLMQGYYFSRPLPVEAATALLTELQSAGPRADWKSGDGGRVVTLVPGLKVAHAA
jgi:EAL domain-containing protein (putative c-di-GMP-specific phosphodiesterase class I)